MGRKKEKESKKGEKPSSATAQEHAVESAASQGGDPQVSSVPQEEPKPCEEPLPPEPHGEYEESVLTKLIVESYEGEKVHGLYEGEGLAQFQGGHTYQGMFSEGLMHGRGTYTWADGVTYEGNFVKNVPTHEGHYTWPDGSVYNGEVQGGIRHGFGMYKCGTYPVSYVGQWFDGKRHGKGTLYYNQEGSSRYEGDFVNNIKSGWGIRRYKSGNIYEGQWERGGRHGEGRMRWLTMTNEEYTGQWVNGIQHGYGTHTWYQKRIPGSQYPVRNEYVGDFVSGVRHGHGKFFYASGATYDGQWVFNKKHGMGKLVSQNGRVYEGEFINDRIPGNPAPAPFSTEIMKVVDGPRSLLVLGSAIEIDITSLLAVFPEKDRKEEIKQMEFALLRHISELKKIYTFYSSLGFGHSPDNTFLMTKFQFWRFLKDCRFHHCNVTLADMDRITNDKTLFEETHSPFEKLLLRNFLTYLIYLSFHIYQKEFGGTSPRLSQCFSKMMAKNILPNACQIKGIFSFRQETVYALSYIDKCWEIYKTFCRLNNLAHYEPTMKMRQFIWMLKDLKLVNKQLPPTRIVKILAKDSPCVRDGDDINLENEIVFLEFFEALLDCALLYVTDEMLMQQVDGASQQGSSSQLRSCSEGVKMSLPTQELSSHLVKAKGGRKEEKMPQRSLKSSHRERRGIQTDDEEEAVAQMLPVMEEEHDSILISPLEELAEKVGTAKEDQKNQLSLWMSRIYIFFVGNFFAKFDHLQILKEIILDNRVQEAELAEQRRIKEEEEEARLYAMWEAEEARKLEEMAAEKAALELEESLSKEVEEGSVQLQSPPKEESPILPPIPPSSKAAAAGKKKKKP